MGFERAMEAVWGIAATCAWLATNVVCVRVVAKMTESLQI